MNFNNKYIVELDIIRAFAVLLVMLVHFSVFDFGWVGVQLFFVLSGYLITKNLLLSKEKFEFFLDYLNSFYYKRVLRIFPLYYFYIFSFFIVLFIHAEYNTIYQLSLPLLTYTINFYAMCIDHASFKGIGHFWSLAVEEQFYLIWPFVVYFVPTRILKYFLLLLIGLIPIFRFFIFYFLKLKMNQDYQICEVININPLSHFDAFASGALIIFLEEKYKNIQFIKIKKIIFISFLVSSSINLDEF
jgi:peptidoglycan/LPS O-acetylase OafA/YrhL